MTEAALRQAEVDAIRAALAQAGGRVSGPGGAAELLGVKPTTLYSRLRRMGLREG
jgi:transcriptional regulator with GAF, ATPase, and Fis domain